MSGELNDSTGKEARNDADRDTMDRANERNRILMEARLLPPHATLTEELMNEIKDHFTHYIEENGVKAAQVAREIQYSPTVISQWLSGNYKGDSAAVTRAINNWMERDARRRESKRPKDYVKTRIAEDVRTYCYLADKNCRMAVIVAPSGTGKTKILKVLTEEMRGLYVCCSENMTMRALLLTLARALDWPRSGGALAELEQYVIERLAGTRRIVFIDEAHQLGPAIRGLRTIHDQAQVPIVMVGTDEIEGATDDRAHGRGQFKSRCIFYNALKASQGIGDPAGPMAGRDLFTVEEIRAFFAKRKIRLDRDAFRLMWSLACLPGHGCLRLVEQVIEIAYELNAEAERFTRDDLIESLRMIELNGFSQIMRQAERQMEQCDEPAALAG